jgi:surface antigen
MDSLVDDWGEYNRERTSFVAWRLSSRNGFTMPFHDNSSGWAADAQSRGYTVDSTPAVGSVAFWTGGNHVAWVEAVHSSPTSIDVEEYNVNNDGLYHEELSKSTTGLQFIHFKDIPATADNSAVLHGDFTGDGRADAAIFLNYGNAQTKFWVWSSTGSAFNAPGLWCNAVKLKWIMLWDRVCRVLGVAC